MRDPERIEPMLALVAEVWRKYPDLRLGQLIDDAAVLASGAGDAVSVFSIEDDVLANGLRRLGDMRQLQAQIEDNPAHPERRRTRPPRNPA